ncbi:hypothetical protein PTSG_02575 [Salpingoeca rosetta]|uniref:Galactose-3-O-sulfotransferase 3 n=1 Tax=Salpingoeca rosetta (strain ATCC 50818 / BSB-021) TaxID=946362 RepID=F2U2P5_SALR5|nr:uncharacterized protein PTSG_02575 [Salpingoeca rosetta]EGD81889.1 hypothetical protein PTSG_02575 [Salpingoeca rosetta]|eukprot:XP_004996072.1 hypothetical protein PTSG_02575 [Salpingoeca rosetta]
MMTTLPRLVFAFTVALPSLVLLLAAAAAAAGGTEQQAGGKTDGNNSDLRFVFVKTHKTGSSTLMVLLGQALERRGLYPAFGDDGHAICSTCIGWPDSFVDPERQLYGADKLNFSACISHMRFTAASQAMVQRFLGEDVPTFSLLRDPFKRLISALRFFLPIELREAGFDLRYMTDSEVNRLFDLMGNRTFARTLSTTTRAQTMLSYAFDFGITDNPFLEPAAFEEAFNAAQRRISLVLLTEEWYMSMAMLRRYIGLEFEDMVWNDQKRWHAPVPDISDATKARAREVLWMDYRIYDHYRTAFSARITPVLQLEAQVIQSTQEAYVRRCQAVVSACVPQEDDLPFMHRRYKEKNAANGVPCNEHVRGRWCA